MAEIASAYVSMLPSAKGFGTKLNSEVGGQVRSSGSTLGKTFGKLFALSAGVVAAAGIGRFLSGSVDEAREAQKVGAQTAAVLKSTGNAAGITADAVGKMATRLSNFSGIDDEAIQSGENLLLTFTNIRNEVGGKFVGTFDQATQAALDMGVALGTDTKSAALALGKALNDPAKGYSKLQRSGVSFTDTQVEQIKNFTKTGDVAKAQAIILGEVTKEFGGSAAAQATAGDKFKVAVGNIKESIGTALLPAIDAVENAFVRFAPQINSAIGGLGPVFKNISRAVAPLVAELRDALQPALEQIFNFFKANPKVLAVLGGALLALVSPVAAVGAGLAVLYAKSQTFRDLFATVIETLQEFGTAAAPVVADVLTRISALVKTQVVPVVESLAATFQARVLPAIKSLAATFVSTVLPAIKSWAQYVTTNVVPVLARIVQVIATNVVPILASLARFVVTQVVPAVAKIVASVGQQLKPVLDQLYATFQQRILPTLQRLLEAFQRAQPTIQKVVLVVLKVVGAVLKFVAAVLGKVLPVIIRLAGFLLEKLVVALIKVIGWIVDVIGYVIDFGKKLVAAVVFAAKFQQGVLDKVGKVVKFFKDLPGRIKGFLSSLPGALKTIGGQIIQGLVNGLQAAGHKVTDYVTSLVNKIPKKIRDLMGIHSPSKVTKQLGEFIAQGLADGIISKGDKVTKAVTALTNSLKSKLKDIKSDFASLVEPISSNFTQGLFDFDTASAFTANLSSVKSTLQTMLANFAKLKGEGLSPGFLYQLFQSGGPALINSLAALDSTSAQQAGSLFGDVMSLSDQLGGNVAGATQQGAALLAEQKKTNALLSAIEKNSKAFAHDVAHAVNKGASDGKRRAA